MNPTWRAVFNVAADWTGEACVACASTSEGISYWRNCWTLSSGQDKRMFRRIVAMVLLLPLLVSFTKVSAQPIGTQSSVPVWGYDVVAEYPHDPEAYTQGLVIIDGELYEGTGLEGRSSLRRVDLKTGEVLQRTSLPDQYFGEGVGVVGDLIYQLTWQSGICFVYDLATFDLVTTFGYDTEGWGLTTDGEHLIMSDGSNRIVYRDPDTFEEVGHIDVFDGATPVSLLNELEYIDGEIWANVYTTDWIVRIDPVDGSVTGWIDLTGLLDDSDVSAPVDVLNGIALDSETGQIYVTGKLWPTLFEIELLSPAP